MSDLDAIVNMTKMECWGAFEKRQIHLFLRNLGHSECNYGCKVGSDALRLTVDFDRHYDGGVLFSTVKSILHTRGSTILLRL